MVHVHFDNFTLRNRVSDFKWQFYTISYGVEDDLEQEKVFGALLFDAAE
jgi:hypothetical protein